jgi:hypothetical protein
MAGFTSQGVLSKYPTVWLDEALATPLSHPPTWGEQLHTRAVCPPQNIHLQA